MFQEPSRDQVSSFWDSSRHFAFEAKNHYPNIFSRDIAHNILALLLYPISECCKKSCDCALLRERIVTSLNLQYYNTDLKQEENLPLVASILRIPDARYLIKNYPNSFPLWLIQDRILENKKDLARVSQFVWILLRLKKTYDQYPFYEPSLKKTNENLSFVYGSQKLGGQKAYINALKRYRSVCHFVLALDILNQDPFDLTRLKKTDIDRFLTLSLEIRKEILALKNSHTVTKNIIHEQDLYPIPFEWALNDSENLKIEPIDHIVQDIKKELKKNR